MTDEDDPGFELDLENEPEEPEDGASRSEPAVRYSNPQEALDELLAPYGYEPVDKARSLLEAHAVTLVKREGERYIFQVQGSRRYITQVIADAVSCDCPNGQARGDEATCYHSIAARVLAMGLAKTWLGDGYVAFEVVDELTPEPPAQAEPEVTLQSTLIRRLSGRFTKQRLEFYSNGSVGIRVWLEYDDPDADPANFPLKGWSAPVLVNLSAYDWELPDHPKEKSNG